MLSLEAVGKSYGTKPAIDDIFLNATPGEITAVIGPNGAGKSTTFRVICGLLDADRGQVLWQSRPIASALPKRKLGFLPEERGLYQDVTVEQLLLYWCALREVKQRAGELVRHWIEKLGLTEKRRSHVRELSKGNQQKLQLATAMLHDPELLVLDEPFSGLDPLNQDLVCRIIEDHRARGATIVLSAHQLALVEKIAQKVIVVSEGKIAEAWKLQASDGSGPIAQSSEESTVWFRSRELEQLREAITQHGGRILAADQQCITASFPFAAPRDLFMALGQLAGQVEVDDIVVAREELHDRYIKAVRRGMG
jgi:ABC-2 type transport system ATP-binding protein